MKRSDSNGQSSAVVTREKVAAPSCVFRFGVFEVDLAGELLRRNGRKVILPHQPFQILALLIEHPGEIVTREEIRHSLWGDDTHVDFDHCLNTAVNKLREVLRDSADNPRFIETIPKKGYRFLAPVVEVRPPEEGAEKQNVPPPAADVARPATRRRWLVAGTVVALLLSSGLWVSLRTSRTARTLMEPAAFTHFPGSEVTPAVSADGRQVAFSWNGEARSNFNLYLQMQEGGQLRRLTSSASDDFGPAYSPDGRQIAFYRRSGDSAGLYLLEAASGHVRRVTGLSIGPSGPLTALTGGPAVLPLQSVSWSSDGRYVSFVDRDSIAAPYGVFLWSLERNHRVRVTSAPPGSLGDSSATFSPQGTMLAFARYQDGFTGDIYVVSLPSGNPVRLTSDSKRIRGLTWSLDGRSIVFSSDREGQPGLWRVAASGGVPQRVSGVTETAAFPSLHAQHDTLVYMHWDGDHGIWRVPLGHSAQPGAELTRLDPFREDNEHPRYSPDGRRIVFSSDRSGPREIWLSDATGANPVQLTSLRAYAGSPRWSPDGRLIAFDARIDGNWDVYVISASGGALRRLAHHAAEDSRPSWSSDGRWIYFRSSRSGTAQIWKAPASGGEAVQVTRHGGFEAVESPDGKVLYYTRRAVRGLWSVPVQGGEEQLVWKDLPENSRNWFPVSNGIYFLSPKADAASPGATLQFLRFSSQRVEQVADVPLITPRESGCSASPDGRWLIFSGRHETETDLALLHFE